jgi:type II secretory pathway pseudopilin PulG
LLLAILAAWAIPNMVEGIEKRKAQSTLSQLKGTLQEVQRNSIKMGKECRVVTDVDINPTYLAVDTATQYVGCLSIQRLNFSGITVTENFPGTGIRFSHRGNTTNIGTFVVESPNARTKYCLVVSNFLGIMRSGVYNGSTSSVSASDCQSSF